MARSPKEPDIRIDAREEGTAGDMAMPSAKDPAKRLDAISHSLFRRAGGWIASLFSWYRY